MRLGIKCLYGLVAGLFLVGSALAATPDDSQARAASPIFRAAPEYHFDEDIHFYFNQKDSFFQRTYFVEWNTSAELAFFSLANRFFFFVDMQGTIDLGRWPNKPILFDPDEVDIGFGPMFEYRFNTVNVGLGLDHHCFHAIDTSNSAMQMYWNKVILNVSSPQFRPEAFRQSIAGTAPLSWDRRVAWTAGLAYSMHDFFGIDTSIISWNQPYLIDLTGEARIVVAKFYGMAAVLDAKTGAYFTRTNTTLWNQQLRAELLTLEGKFGLNLFVNWVVVDQLPVRQNKDRLVGVGLDGFK